MPAVSFLPESPILCSYLSFVPTFPVPSDSLSACLSHQHPGLHCSVHNASISSNIRVLVSLLLISPFCSYPHPLTPHAAYTAGKAAFENTDETAQSPVKFPHMPAQSYHPAYFLQSNHCLHKLIFIYPLWCPFPTSWGSKREGLRHIVF